MQLKELWSALIRRWYLVLFALLIAAAGTFAMVRQVGPTYESEGVVLIVPPGVSGSGASRTIGNPYLSLGGVSQARDVVIRTLSSRTFLEDLCASPGDAGHREVVEHMCNESPPSLTFEVAPDFTSSAPMIVVTVNSKSRTAGGVALTEIVDRVPGILKDLQRDVVLDRKSLITSTPVVMDLEPEVVNKKQIRLGIVAGAGLFGISVLAIAVIDALLLWRRDPGGGRRRPGRRAASVPNESDPEGRAGTVDKPSDSVDRVDSGPGDRAPGDSRRSDRSALTSADHSTGGDQGILAASPGGTS